MTKDLYVLSGLGADESVFHKIDFAGYTPTYIEWEIPGTKETIEHYAQRLAEQINTPRPILIGLSFGGMLAVEIAKIKAPAKVILIASAKTKDEIPPYYRALGKTKLHRLVPYRLLKRPGTWANWFFGAMSRSEKKLLKQVLYKTNTQFLKWAVDQILNWRNTTKVEPMYHIHGTADKLLPLRFVDCNFAVEDGGHLMVLGKAEAINDLLRKILDEDREKD